MDPGAGAAGRSKRKDNQRRRPANLSFMGWAGVMLLTCEGLRGWRDLELVTWLSRFGGFIGALGIIQYFTGSI